jgi:hypothetical protein
MFDEAQEGTSIFKCAENASMIPAGQYFLTLDADSVACSSDFYLRLTKDGGSMVKGLIPYTATHPTPHMPLTSVLTDTRPVTDLHTIVSQRKNGQNVIDVPVHCEKIQVVRMNGAVVYTYRAGTSTKNEIIMRDLKTGIYLIRATGPGINVTSKILGGNLQ